MWAFSSQPLPLKVVWFEKCVAAQLAPAASDAVRESWAKPALLPQCWHLTVEHRYRTSCSYSVSFDRPCQASKVVINIFTNTFAAFSDLQEEQLTSGERWKRSTTRGHHKPQSVSWKSSQVVFWGLAGCSSPSKTSRAKLARWEVPMLGKSQKSLSRYQSIMAVQAARMSRSCYPRWVIFWPLRRLSSGSPLAARTPPWWRTCAPSAGPTCAKRTPGSRWRGLELRWSMLFQSWGWVFKHNMTYAMIPIAWSVKAGEIYLVIGPESDHFLALSVTL